MTETPAPTADAADLTAADGREPAAPSAERVETVVAPTVAGDPFSTEEYRQFALEDGRAGKLIGWLLCALFVYTILVASAAIWWTMHAV